MERFEIVPAGRVYANQLAPHLRIQDKIEVYAASGMDPLEALLGSIEVSDEDMCWAALLNKLPIGMFGANPIHMEGEHTVGGIWMLTSPGIYTNKREFMRVCRKYLAIMHERYEFLTNFIDSWNIPSMRWLPYLGFKVVGTVDDYGFEKVPFVQYVSKRK